MNSDKNVLYVIAPKDFREEEYFNVKTVLENSGVSVKTVASTTGECYGTGGQTALADFELASVNSIDFDAVLFAGGPGVELYFTDQSAINLVLDFYNNGKIVGAICWASVLLAKAGIVNGKKVTGWTGGRTDIEAAGGSFTGELVTVDGNIVTAIGPTAAEEFGQKVADMLMG